MKVVDLVVVEENVLTLGAEEGILRFWISIFRFWIWEEEEEEEFEKERRIKMFLGEILVHTALIFAGLMFPTVRIIFFFEKKKKS